MAANMKPVLYSYFRSTCSWRVRIALALKGIEYEYRAVHLLKDGGEQLADSYKAINPQCEVPTLLIDGHTLTQSMAIVEYLDETQGPPYLLPRDDPHRRQQVRAVSQCVACGIQPIQNLRVLKFVGDEKKAEWGKHWIELGFNSLEKLLETTAGKYSVGDEVTMADLMVLPQVYNANRFKVDMSAYPTITRIEAALSELEAFKKAHPTQQPDCPPELK
ncbi:Maleylacetoacetate isomerase [Geodia barretti]|uniref:Maleylacetoacetate isomerase n=1 Tax=Geodia barretti TaxID=519541 RepID=A0AA35R2Q4_GEOBA|nr:Maleylacetoacetate isomerase [Geodia barretti]